MWLKMDVTCLCSSGYQLKSTFPRSSLFFRDCYFVFGVIQLSKMCRNYAYSLKPGLFDSVAFLLFFERGDTKMFYCFQVILVKLHMYSELKTFFSCRTIYRKGSSLLLCTLGIYTLKKYKKVFRFYKKGEKLVMHIDYFNTI